MSDSTKKPAAADTSSASPLTPVPDAAREMSEPEEKRKAQRSNHPPSAVPEGPGSGDDSTEALKRRLEETRLPADVKARILAELPPPEECEQIYRELQEKGGLSFEQLCAALGLEVKPKS
jgi:hypothetical protein